MKVTFFFKCSKFSVDFKNAVKISENVSDLKRIAFDLVAGNFLNYDKNTYDRPSTF